MTINVDSTTLESLSNSVSNVSRRTLTQIGQTVVSDLLLGFRNEVEPNGEAWKPLSIATIKARRRRGVGAKILQDTGNLKRSLNKRVTASNTVSIGYSAIYSVYHHATRKI